MAIRESVMLTTYLILKVYAKNLCEGKNGIRRCCNDYRMENGTCVVCPAGYHGTNCTSVCPKGFYGVRCLHQCRCKQGLECSPIRGCQKPGCGSIPVMENTEVSSMSSSYGSKATYKCVKGFIQSGIDSITCLNNGTWETPSVHCDSKDCGPPPNISFALTEVDGTGYGSVAQFSCFENYFGEGIDTVTCTAEGVWENIFFVCSKTEGTKQRTHSSGFLYVGVTVFFIVVIIIVVILFHISFRIFTERNKLDLKFQNSIEMHIYSETDDQQV